MQSATSPSSSSRGFVVVAYGADEDGDMVAVKPKQCLASLSGAEGSCKMGEAGWRERTTGPCHPLQKVRCREHQIAFTLYPEGYVPYGRVPVMCMPEPESEPEGRGEPDEREPVDHSEADTKSGLVGAAIAAGAGERWERDLIEGESGPVLRTQQRWIKWLGTRVGLDGELSSEVLSELGLNAIEVRGKLTERVAALGKLTGREGWLRLAGALDLVCRHGPVWVIPDPRNGRVVSARSSLARAMRGPPPG